MNKLEQYLVFGMGMLLTFFSQCLLAGDSGETPHLFAGTAFIDITPEQPVQLAGYSSRKELSAGVHDRLYARAVVFERAGETLVLVSTDLLGFYNDTFETIAGEIRDTFLLKPSQLFLSSIHTHSGPALTLDAETGHEHNLEYTHALQAKLLKVIAMARDRLKPVQIGVGHGASPVGANRRESRVDDSGWPRGELVKLGRNPDGLVDRDVQVIKVASLAGTPVALFFDYACHATALGPKNLIISGDVLGLAEQFVEKIVATGVVSLALAGASGDIDPWYRVLPGFHDEPGWIPEPVLLATLLGQEVIHVFRVIDTYREVSMIVSDFTTMNLPAKNTGRYDPQEQVATRALNLTTARIGDIAFVGIGGEVLTEIGMAIKAASPFDQTLVITHCNGAAGYLPPAHLYKEGGYEVTSSKFAPLAADLVVKQVLKMLYGLWQRS